MPTMFKPVAVESRPNYCLWIRYQDGSEGEIDLSSLIEQGVFTQLKDEALFERVKIGEEGAIRWNEELELCSDDLYLKLTDQKPEDVLPKLKSETHA